MARKFEIVPSIIASSQAELDRRVKKIKNYCSTYQIDVMDGKFVKNKSFQFDFKLPKTKHRVEAQLMVKNPLKWIEKNYSKVSMIIIHIESFKTNKEVDRAIKFVKSRVKKVGIVIKPRTSVKSIKSFIDKVDMVSFMTVNPGRYGAKFLPFVLEKVRLLRKFKPNLDIEVDGGITLDTIGLARKAGANLFVCGSYLQESKNIKKAFSKLILELK